ncbi:hypothetical protein O181_025029 [Austropuccinia psidii MF-1]|uniref:Uncharacterized protein n=1 Tax=Austropuccinia psidii MF-1 TaxID=1389203 RepID=A0A9Q3CJS0_9BASI|nr:hypothetical protein [Austropuccinia psidii MF-1]
METKLHIKSSLSQEKIIEPLGGWSPFSSKEKLKKMKNWLNNQSILSVYTKKELEMTPSLQKRGPVASTSSTPTPELPKDNPKGPQKRQRGPKSNQGKGKGKESSHRPYPPGYRIPRLEALAMESVFNVARSLIELTAK